MGFSLRSQHPYNEAYQSNNIRVGLVTQKTVDFTDTVLSISHSAFVAFELPVHPDLFTLHGTGHRRMGTAKGAVDGNQANRALQPMGWAWPWSRTPESQAKTRGGHGRQKPLMIVGAKGISPWTGSVFYPIFWRMAWGQLVWHLPRWKAFCQKTIQ